MQAWRITLSDMTDTDLENVILDWHNWKANLKNIYKGLDLVSLYASLDAEDSITKQVNKLRMAIWDQDFTQVNILYEQVQSSIDHHKQEILVNILKREPHPLPLRPSSHS